MDCMLRNILRTAVGFYNQMALEPLVSSEIELYLVARNLGSDYQLVLSVGC